MTDWATSIAVASARSILVAANDAIRILGTAQTPTGRISMAPRQAEELGRFLKAYCDELASLADELEKSPNDSFAAQLLVARQSDLEQGLAFIKSAFIAPRLQSEDQQALEAADWMCVEVFLRFIPDQNGPIGPLVAVDARRSPAIWEASDSLPLPSLFRVQPSLLERTAAPDVAETVLKWFPLICMPANLTLSPEFLPLLSHEVGHAVDHEMGLSDRIVAGLPQNAHRNYWSAWIREIIADFIALMVSGEAFALALSGYVRFMSVSEEITTSSSYPGIKLRLAFLGDAIHLIEGNTPSISRSLRPEDSFGKLGDELRAAFLQDLLPVLTDKLGFDRKAQEQWRSEQKLIRNTATTVVKWMKDPTSLLKHSISSFVPLPSVVALSKLKHGTIDSLMLFRKLHEQLSSTNRPAWVQSSCNWQFTLQTLPALRPTYLASDGQTKIPPRELLRHHNQIVFVAATNGQLTKSLTEAYKIRGRAWQSLEFCFLDDDGLARVERDTEPPVRRQVLTRHLIKERNQAIRALKKLLRTGIAERWVMYSFSGPLIFCSYWDVDSPGGRIHISYQLLGTDLRQCPSTDLVWHDVVPSMTFQKYRKHLELLRERATKIAASDSESK